MSSTYTNGDKRMKQIKLNKEDLCEFKYTVNGIKIKTRKGNRQTKS